MNEETVVYSDLKKPYSKKPECKAHPAQKRRGFPWHIIAVFLGTTCFLLLLAVAGLGYMYFQSTSECKIQDMEDTKEQNTSCAKEVGDHSILPPSTAEMPRFLTATSALAWVCQRQVSGSKVFLPTELAKELFLTCRLLGHRKITYSLISQLEASNGIHVSEWSWDCEGGHVFCFQEIACATYQGKWICDGKNCYYFSKEEKTWNNSKESCEDLNSSLVKIDDKDEQKFIKSHIKYNHWVGLQKKGTNRWRWLNDGSELSKHLDIPQMSNKRDTNCGYLKPTALTNDVCTKAFYYICERKFTCLANKKNY